MPETYWIDGKEVTKGVFDAFLKALTELPHSWYCAETTEGGDTGYDAEDAAGVRYAFVASSTQLNSKSTITRI